jgi:hypothetical protein
MGSLLVLRGVLIFEVAASGENRRYDFNIY